MHVIGGTKVCTYAGVGSVALAAPQPGPTLNPNAFHPTGSPRASMYSRKRVPAEWPCMAGPGLRCASPLKADHVLSVPTVTTLPLES